MKGRSGRHFLPLLGMLLLVGGLWSQTGAFARVSYVEGEARILRGDTGEWDYLDPNYLVAEGDLITTAPDARVELEFNRGALVFLDEGSELEVTRLRRDEGHFEATFYLREGTLRAHTPRESDLSLLVETPAAAVEVEARSDIKVRSRPSGYTEVYARKGSARIRTEETRLWLSEGEWVKIDPYGEIVDQGRWSRWDEDFDYWCRRRIREVVVVEYVPVDIGIGVWELSHYGRWTYVVGYGWVWVPPVTSARWRPYFYGRWVYRVEIGWVWVSFEPWGWVPYHYGRWAYISGIGWIWIPGRVFAPAWVSWCWGPDWVAWAPLGPGDMVLTTVYVDGFYLGAYTVVSRESFFHPRVRYKRPPLGGGTPRPVYVVKEGVQPREWQKEPLPAPEKIATRPMPHSSRPTPELERDRLRPIPRADRPRASRRENHIDVPSPPRVARPDRRTDDARVLPKEGPEHWGDEEERTSQYIRKPRQDRLDETPRKSRVVRPEAKLEREEPQKRHRPRAKLDQEREKTRPRRPFRLQKEWGIDRDGIRRSQKPERRERGLR